MEEERKEWVAFVGHLEGGQVSAGPLRLFCSPACVTKAGYKKFQPITESAAAKSPFVDASGRCSQCGKEFTTPAPA